MKRIFEVDEQGRVRYMERGPRNQLLREIPRVCSTRQACRRLKRSRRHLYRWIGRGWLRPAARFFGDLYFDERDVQALRHHRASWRTASLSKRLAPLFPEYDLRSLHPGRDADLVLSRILERGTTSDVRWALSLYPFKRRRQFLRTQGRRALSPRALRFWSWLWNAPLPPPARDWRKAGRALGGVL